MINSLVEKIKKKVMLADGAMGTYFSQKYMTEMEAEEANIATPERIIAIHKEYIEAGAELIRTNTFAVNHGLFDTAEKRKEVIEAAVATLDNARQFENILEEVFDKISAELNAPDTPIKPSEDKMLDFQTQKMERDFAIKREQNQIKREELNLKKISELNKISKN